jgi:hypothetical protein
MTGWKTMIFFFIFFINSSHTEEERCNNVVHVPSRFITYAYCVDAVAGAATISGLCSIWASHSCSHIFIVWDIMTCTLLKVWRRFGGTRFFHLQGLRISHQDTGLKLTVRRNLRRFGPERKSGFTRRLKDNNKCTINWEKSHAVM